MGRLGIFGRYKVMFSVITVCDCRELLRDFPDL